MTPSRLLSRLQGPAGATLLTWAAGAGGLLLEGPGWLALPWLAALACRPLSPARQRLLQCLLLAGVAAALSVGHGWLDGTALRALPPLLVALKWAESRQPRDWAITLAGALIVLALAARYRLDLGGLALTLLGLGGAMLALLALAGRRQRWQAALPQLGLGLTLASLAFFAFPRLPGPLWEAGLSLGLPLAMHSGESAADLGFKRELAPGQATSASDGRSRPVIVARFEQYVPQTSRLYWRGPVFTRFDGQRWRTDHDDRGAQLARGFRRRDAFLAQLPRREQAIRYEARISAHGERWLYGLDLPAAVVTESYISAEGQLLSFTRLHQEARYRQQAWLEYDWKPPLPAAEQDALRSWPQASNPRLHALGAAASGDASQRVARVIQLLQDAGLRYRSQLAPYTGPAAYDHYWFSRREADSPLLAGAFALLLRSSGVPARVVSGYRGGRLVALTNVVIVKQEHAHAWVEAWQGAQGWIRYDPSDLLLAAQAGKAGPQARPAAAPAGARQQDTPARAAAPAAGDWRLPDTQLLAGWLQRWVLQLDADSQQQAWRAWRQQGGHAGWLLLLAAPFSLSWLWRTAQRWRQRQRRPANYREWQALERQLAGLGLARAAPECVSDYLARLPDTLPARAELQTLGARYLRWRFAGASDPTLAGALRAWRQQLG